MAINNNGNQLDSAGNVQVDFVWGNFPMQPNDVRPDNAPSDAVTTTQGRLSTTAATSKNLHFVELGAWNGYPGNKENTLGEFTGTAATATAVANYAPAVAFPEVKTLKSADALDAIKDAGITATTTVTANGAGGRANISNVVRVVTTGVTTITTAADPHGFNVGDVVGISLSTADSGSLNGTWVITGTPATNTFTFTCSTTTAISSVSETTGDVHVIGTRTKPISNVQAVAAGTAVAIPVQTPVVADGTNVTLTTSAPHGLVVGQMVAVASLVPSGYNNATAQVTAVPTATTFTYANATTGAVTTAGTVTPNAYMVLTALEHGFARGDVVTTLGTTDSNFTVSAKSVRWIPTYDGYVNGIATKIASKDLFVLDYTGSAIASKEDVAGIAVAVSTVASAKAKALTSIGFPDAATVVYGATAHGYSVGDPVHISKITTSGYTGLNNTQGATDTITAVTPNSFTIAKAQTLTATLAAGSVTAAVGGAGIITFTSSKNPLVGSTVSVTGLSFVIPTQTPVLNAPSSVTLTTSTAHGLTVGSSVVIASTAASSGTPTTIYNGTFVVTGVPSTTSFTVSNPLVGSSAPAVTTAGTAATPAGSGLNVTSATVVTSSGSAFTVNSPVVATSSAAAGSVSIYGVADATGTSYVAVKTGTVKSQTLAAKSGQAITAANGITTFN